MPDKIIFLTTTGAGTWNVPSDWTNVNKVEVIGGGAGGRSATSGGGGGGGAYSSVTNITTLTPGSTVVNFSVGVGGAAGASGGDTWFGATTLAASLVAAKGGIFTSTVTGGPGGASSQGIPATGGVRFSGGQGGTGSASVLTGGGGGGAAGPGGIGGIGGNGDTTTAGADFGGGGGGGAGSVSAGSAGGAGTTTAGLGGAVGSFNGGAGGDGGAGAGVAAVAATGLWTSTHAADGITASVAGASTGGGGGGKGSTAGVGGAGANYGGGGGSGTTGGVGRQGIIIIRYTPAPAPDAWNNTDKSADITLSNNDKTATTAEAIALGIRSTTKRVNGTAGKYYAEFLCTQFSGNATVGIQATSATINSPVAAVCALGGATFNIRVNDVASSYGVGQIVTGDLVCIAWDAGAELIWFKRNTGLWNNNASANPATGVNGVNMSVLANTDHALWFKGNNLGDSVTIRTRIAEFTQVVPTGFASWMGELPTVADAWDVSDKSATITLSNADKTAATTSVTSGIRSTKSVLNGAAGLYYAELKLDAHAANINFGIKSKTSPLTSGGTESVYVSTINGNIAQDAVTKGSIGTPLPVTGDVLCLAYKSGTQEIWFRKNNGLWNNNAGADPAAGVGGIDISIAPDTAHCLWFVNGGTVNTATLRTEVSEFTQAVPAGFTSWMGETPDAWNRLDTSGTVVFTNGDKTATISATSSAARSTTMHAQGVAGKYYAEFAVGATNITGIALKQDQATAGAANSSTGRLFWFGTNGNILLDATLLTTINTFAANAILSLAWNAGAKLIWFRNGAGNWNNNASANPATGVGGIDISGLSNANVALNFLASTVGASVTVRTKLTEFTQSFPAGFASWMGEVPPVATPDAWNVFDKTAPVTLSNNDKTALASVSGYTTVRSTKAWGKKVVVDTAKTGQIIVPEGATAAKIEGWGAGGGGFGGGGSGGAYARVNALAVTPGDILYYSNPSGTTGSDPDIPPLDTWVRLNTNAAPTTAAQGILAKSGQNAHPTDFVGRAGGQASASIGDVKYSGGAAGNTDAVDDGGGGGGAAGDHMDGTSAFDSGSNHVGGFGGDDFGGDGGRGANSTGTYIPPGNGQAPGGGGGGSWTASDAYGANGRVVVTFDIPAPTGKYYAEFKLDALSPVIWLGIVDTGLTIAANSVPFEIGIAASYRSDGPITSVDDRLGTNVGALVTGDTLCVSYDAAALSVGFRKNNGSWTDISVASAAQEMLALGVTFGSATDKVTLRTEMAEFEFAPRAGYGSWMGEPGAPSDNGVLNAGAAAVAGVGVSSAAGTGTLAAQNNAVLSAAMVSGSTGTGVLTQADWSYQIGTTASAFGYGFGTGSTEILMEAFVAPATKVASVQIGLRKDGAPTDGVVAQIWNSDGLFPSTQVGQSSSVVPAASLTTANAPVTQTLTFTPPINVIAGNTYALVMSRTGALDNVNYFGLSYETAGTFPGYALRKYQSGAWAYTNLNYDIVASIQFGGGSALAGSGLARWVATAAALNSAPAQASATGLVQSPPATGTGVLTSIATLAATGVSQSLGTSILVAPDRTMTGAGISQIQFSAALVNNPATTVAAGISRSISTSASLVASPNFLQLGTGLSASLGTGTLPTGLAAIVATGVAQVPTGTGTLVAGTAQLAGSGLVVSAPALGTGSLAATLGVEILSSPNALNTPPWTAVDGATIHNLTSFTLVPVGGGGSGGTQRIEQYVFLAGSTTYQYHVVLSGTGKVLIDIIQEAEGAWISVATQVTLTATPTTYTVICKTEPVPGAAFVRIVNSEWWGDPTTAVATFGGARLRQETPVGIAALASFGTTASFGTAPLQPAASTLTAVGLSQVAATGTLTASPATTVAPGISESRSTSATLLSQSNFLQLGNGLSRSLGTGAAAAGSAVLAGVGAGAWFGTGALNAAASSNLLRYSEEFENAQWTLTAATITANATTAPDTTTTAERITDSAASSPHYASQTAFGLTNGGPYVVSVYAKADTLQWLQLSATGIRVNFNVATGAIGLVSGANVTGYSVRDAGGGWYRCVMAFNAPAATLALNIMPLPSDVASPVYVGTSKSLYLWGAQLTPGTVLRDYVKSTANVPALSYYQLAGAGVARWAGTGALTNPDLSKVVGVGVSAWVASGTMPAGLATLVGIGTSGLIGTGTLITGISALEAAGFIGAGGIGDLQGFSTLAGAGVSRSVATSSALPTLPATIVASAVSQSLGTGTLISGISGTTGAGLSISTGTGTPAGQVASLTGTGAVSFAATGTLPSGVAAIAAAGAVGWAGTGVLAPSASAVASVGLSRSLGTAPLQATLAFVSGFEGVTVVSGTGTMPSQSALIAGFAIGRSSGTGLLLEFGSLCARRGPVAVAGHSPARSAGIEPRWRGPG